MKLKQLPADFQVEELTDAVPAAHGPFAFYLLEKSGWTTPDAIGVMCRRWGVESHRVSYGGLKDRHAETRQYLTIRHGPRRGLEHGPVRVRYLGQLDRAFDSTAITANRFRVTLRQLSPAEIAVMTANAAELVGAGIPNYFDDQRFGSVGRDEHFAAKDWVHGRFEDGLRHVLTAPYEYDGPRQKAEKRTLLANWGNWAECRQRLPAGHARSLVCYLGDHPDDFRGAVERLRPELQGLYLSAFQSELWNRVLAAWLTERVPAENLTAIEMKRHRLPVPRTAVAELEELRIPLPSARSAIDPESEIGRITARILAEEGLTLDQVKIPGLRKPFFSRGDRAASLRPAGLELTPGDDERHVGRSKLVLAFELPRGSYATMVVKRLVSGSG